MQRYYSTQRPVTPGCYPRIDGNKVLNIQDFDIRLYCPEIGRSAWGYIEYESPIPEAEASAYELVKAIKNLSL